MDSIEEKAVVKISAEGEVMKCAKGMDVKECGYKGGKVCGACGAMAVEAKADAEETTLEVSEKDASEDVEVVAEDAVEEKTAKADDAEEGEEENEEENEEEDEEEMEATEEVAAEKSASDEIQIELIDESAGVEEKAFGAPAPVMGDEEDEEDEEEAPETPEAPEAEMDEEEEEDGKGYGMMKPSKRSRRMAMKSLGVDEEEDVFLCQLDRKVYPTSSNVCEGCNGGCAPEEGMPGILDIEGVALDMFGGKVLSSGFAEEADLFIVDVMGKDGRAFEILADGQTGEVVNFHRLTTSDLDQTMGQKSLQDAEQSLVDIKSAEKIALEMLKDELGIEGKVLEADSDLFEGYDSYVFEIDGENGKSYDAFVGLAGERFGYDEYDASEVIDIEAEAAELALKRMYSDDEREKMSESGMALEDGSFPIKDVDDLKNAIQAYGRAKNKDKAKAHIIKRAMDLDSEDLIPENWVPKKIAEEAAQESGEKSADDEFMAKLMEFEMLAVEEDLGDS